jgi:hypothetical protein
MHGLIAANSSPVTVFINDAVGYMKLLLLLTYPEFLENSQAGGSRYRIIGAGQLTMSV